MTAMPKLTPADELARSTLLKIALDEDWEDVFEAHLDAATPISIYGLHDGWMQAAGAVLWTASRMTGLSKEALLRQALREYDEAANRQQQNGPGED